MRKIKVKENEDWWSMICTGKERSILGRLEENYSRLVKMGKSLEENDERIIHPNE